MSNLTFGIIKPDAVRAGNQGKIVDRILGAGFGVRGMKLIHQTRKQAEGFYAVHAGKGFYDELCDFMSSGPCVVLALEKENAVPAWRELMGATNPAEAAAGRPQNSTHDAGRPTSGRSGLRFRGSRYRQMPAVRQSPHPPALQPRLQRG